MLGQCDRYSMYPIRFNVFVDYSVDLRLFYRSERSNSVFNFLTFGVSSELRVCSKYLFFGVCVLFLEQPSISEIFKILSKGDDKG